MFFNEIHSVFFLSNSMFLHVTEINDTNNERIFKDNFIYFNIQNPQKSIYSNICNMDQVKVKC